MTPMPADMPLGDHDADRDRRQADRHEAMHFTAEWTAVAGQLEATAASLNDTP